MSGIYRDAWHRGTDRTANENQALHLRPKFALEAPKQNLPRVLVSNATRLHAHHHAYALQKVGMLQSFITSLWSKPEREPYRTAMGLPGRAGRTIRSFLAKRSHPTLDPDLVEQQWLPEAARLAADLVTFGCYRGHLHFAQKIAHDRIVARRVRKLQPDVVVGYEISCSRTFASAKEIGALTVLDLAGMHHDFVTPLARGSTATPVTGLLGDGLRGLKLRELALADHIVTVSELARQSLIDHGVPSARVSVVRLGVALDTFRPKLARSPTNQLRVLFVGNISRAKGVDRLLKAFRLLRQHTDAELVIIGSQAERDFLAPFAGLFRHVPYLPHRALASEMQHADLLVLPSLFDSWGMVVAEAMATATPIVVTDMCGASELVTPDCGWVVPAGDVNALAMALRDAASDRERLVRMGHCARLVAEGLDWDNYHRRVAGLIAHIWRDARSADNKASIPHRGGKLQLAS